MTTLVANPIGAFLEQEFTYNLDERCHIGAFYPYLLMHNEPAGVFTFELLSGAEVLFSKNFTSADIKTALNTANSYAHVFYPIIPDVMVQLESGTYKIRISTSGYTESFSSYVAWLQQFEDIQNEMSYVPSASDQNSLAFRVKSYKEGIR